MKLIVLYGNADFLKRKNLAEKIMKNNANILVIVPEITTTDKSYYLMEKELMEFASLSIIFVESLATCFELSMLKEFSNVKILYVPKGNNELLKGSSFIEDTIIKEFKRKDVINCSINKLVVHYNNNIIPEVNRKYNIGQITSKLDLMRLKDYDMSRNSTNLNLMLRINLYILITEMIDYKVEEELRFNLLLVKEKMINLIFKRLITKAMFNKNIKEILVLMGCINVTEKSKDAILREFNESINSIYKKCEEILDELS